MLKLYEYDEKLANLLALDLDRAVDTETGEILTAEAVNDLLIERNAKIEGCMLFYLEQDAEEKALDAEIKKLTARKKTVTYRGTSDIAVISLGGPVVSESVKVAGDDFDEAIIRFMRKKHNLLIGERTAEDIKVGVGCVYKRPENLTMEVRGRNLVTGLPKTVQVTSDEMLEALSEPASQIVNAVHNVLERTPPELAADIYDRGIVMTGGGSLIYGLDQLIEEKTGINTVVAEDPLSAVAIGTGRFIELANGSDED